MNWLQKIALDWDSKYPLAGSMVNGLKVREEVPNMSSISSSLLEYKILPGVCEIPMWDVGGARDAFYAHDDIQNSLKLAEEIKVSREISPLIVEVNEKDDLDIIEGVHRLAALSELGAKSFPAIVVVDLEQTNELVTENISKVHAFTLWYSGCRHWSRI